MFLIVDHMLAWNHYRYNIARLELCQQARSAAAASCSPDVAAAVAAAVAACIHMRCILIVDSSDCILIDVSPADLSPRPRPECSGLSA